MKKKDPLRLPSVLQHELGMGGSGGASSGKKQHKKKAPLSRKELRKQERQEKKQRKVTTVAGGNRGRPDESSQRAGEAGTNRARPNVNGGGASSSSSSGNGAPVRKSLGLVERARGGGKASTSSSSKAKKEKKAAAAAAAAAAVRKDPFILAEEEEIRYLERKLGLAGKDGKKKEEKLLRDLMKYEGFDYSIGDLLQATNRISELVSSSRRVGGSSSSSSSSNGEKRKEKKETKKKVGGSRLEALLLAQRGGGGRMEEEDEGEEVEEGEAGAWDYEADLGSGEEEDEEEEEEEECEEEEEGSEEEIGGGEGGVPDFFSSDEEDEGEEDEYEGEPMEVDMGEEGDEDEEGSEEDSDDDDNDDDDQEEQEQDEDSDASSSSSTSSTNNHPKESKEVTAHAYRPVQGEDIYGRSTDPSLGPGGPAGKYIPPHLRRAAAAAAAAATTTPAAVAAVEEDDTSSPEYIMLKKVMNGLANRLSETNLEPSIRELCALYSSHPRSRVNRILTDTLLSLCVSKTQVMKGLVPVYAALVAGAHFAGGGSGGGGVGAFVLERVCREYDATRKKLEEEEEGGEDEDEEEERLARELDNLVLILGYLYAFGLVACGLIYDLIRELVAKLGERDVELLLLLLRTAGHQLRGDDPAALKDIVFAVQERAEEVMEGGREGGRGSVNARVRHMLETINDLKNNKKRQAQVQEWDRTQRLKKVVQRARSSSSSARKGGGETLHLTWADIRASDERGRWWRVGASWAGKQQPQTQDDEEEEQERKSSSSSSATETTLQAKITKLAAKQRMNTDVRRAIFASVMTASDYQDAFERLMRLNLTVQQEREVVRVLIDCAGQEKGYNPFYAYLAGRLCEYHDKYKFTLQLTYWDVFKLLDEEGAGFAPPAAAPAKKGAAAAAAAAAVSPQHRRAINLAKTLCHLIAKGWLSLSVLKVVDVAGLGEGGGVFFRAFFTEFLDEESCPDSEVLGAVQRVGSSKDHLTLTETLTAFLHRYAFGGEGEGEEGKKRKKRAKSVVKLLEKLSVSQFMGGGRGGAEGGWRGRRGEGDDDWWDGM